MYIYRPKPMITTTAQYAARIVELENELALTREAIKPFADFIRPMGDYPNESIITKRFHDFSFPIHEPVTAQQFRRLAACGNPA